MSVLSAVRRRVPWWARVVAKVITARIPVSYEFWSKIGLYRHGSMDNPEYAISVFESHVRRAGMDLNCLGGKTIVEIGPGDSCATAFIAHAYGAASILIDAGAYAVADPVRYAPLCDALRARGLEPVDVRKGPCLASLLDEARSRYLVAGLASWKEIPTESVDLVFSHAVLEHIRLREFAAVMKECARVMRPDARASHCVDLKDHLGGGLNNLRFSETHWESEFFVKSGFYTNRIRLDQMLGMFRDAGFQVSALSSDSWDSLPLAKKKMSADFGGVPDDVLRVSGFSCVLQRD